MTDRRALLRQLPAIDRLLNTAPRSTLATDNAHVQLRAAAQRAVEELRARMLDEREPPPDLDPTVVAQRAGQILQQLETPSLRRVLNLSGTVLHTNLGRAPLAASALQAVLDVSRGYSTLEYDLAAGKRGERHVHVEELLCRLTGAESALAVNNNAGAVLLALSALAGGKSALVSRGELIVKVTRNSVDFVLIQKTSRARKGKDGSEGVPEKFWSVNLEEAALSDVDAWLGHYADKTSVLLDYAQSTLDRNVKAAQLKIDSSDVKCDESRKTIALDYLRTLEQATRSTESLKAINAKLSAALVGKDRMIQLMQELVSCMSKAATLRGKEAQANAERVVAIKAEIDKLAA